MANSVDLDEVAHYEPPHQDLCCLRVQLILSLVLKDVRTEQKRMQKENERKKKIPVKFVCTSELLRPRFKPRIFAISR